MAYIFQEYPKNVDGIIVNSREEEDNARRLRENERLISEKRNEEEKRAEESRKNMELEAQGQSSGTEGTHDEEKGNDDTEGDEENPQERFRIVEIGNGAKRRFTKKEYLKRRFDPLPEEILEYEYRCLQCGKGYSKDPKYLNAFKRHKENHELATKIIYGNQ